jgi:hypothetical protein
MEWKNNWPWIFNLKENRMEKPGIGDKPHPAPEFARNQNKGAKTLHPLA